MTRGGSAALGDVARLAVPGAQTVPIRDLAKGLVRLAATGGRIAVNVADEF